MRRLKQTWIAAALGMSVWMTACAGAASETATQEGAKRVLMMAAVIIIGGGILNHIVNEHRKRDYTGKRRI